MLRIALAQINPTVGDYEGNTGKILAALAQAQKNQCGLLVFPEMALPGYPAEDLILKPAFVNAGLAALKNLARHSKKTSLLVGFIHREKNNLFNAAAWLSQGKIQEIYCKQQLPNYGVFDEARYFKTGTKPLVISLGGLRVGVTICEDIWVGPTALQSLALKKPDVVVNLSASPFHQNKVSLRHHVATSAAKTLRAPLLYCNMVGGQDELVFDGGSFCVSNNNRLIVEAARFKEDVLIVDLKKNQQKKGVSFYIPSNITEPAQPIVEDIHEIHEALVLGLKDYVNKNKFNSVALGISGGIDSALVATLAVKALGKERVIGVTMPSRFNTRETISDSHQLAQNLGIQIHEIAIGTAFDSLQDTLKPLFSSMKTDTTEENMQARIRGNILMALSNKFGWLILTTGNKSETSTGYCTLYGDTAGGFAVIKDVLKTTVYDLCRYINAIHGTDLIPNSIIQRPPTAELRDNQKDEDSLGAYSDLDRVIVAYVENNMPLKKIALNTKLPSDYIEKVVKLIDRNEYKRRQAPPGIKITPRSFGRDHRMPITNRFFQKTR